MKRYEITSPSIIHCGVGSFSLISEESVRLGKKAAIVTGSHLHSSEKINRLANELSAKGLTVHLCESVTQEPTVTRVDDLVSEFSKIGADIVIAIGGGSVMDTAKAAAIIFANGGLTEDYQLKRREIVKPPIAQIFVPTTAGTGSESTRVSVLTNENEQVKRSISHPLMTPNVVILDPELTKTCSNYLTTITAMDAFAHAIESAVSKNATPYTRHIALAGIEELSQGLEMCLFNNDDLDARLKCLLGSTMAGLAMQNGLGASHSLAPAVCIVGKIRHAEAVGALLPNTIKLNEKNCPGVYDEVKRAVKCDDIADYLEKMCKIGGFMPLLEQFELTQNHWQQILKVMTKYGSHRQTNPAEVTDSFAEELFKLSISRK